MTSLSKLGIVWRRWKHRDILVWRVDLSEYESDFLLPELKGRTEALLSYFKEIEKYCNDRADEQGLGTLLRELLIDSKLEHLVPLKDRPISATELTKKFFKDLKEGNHNTFIKPLSEVLKLFKDEMSLKEFGKLLIQLNFICSTILEVKNELFYYQFRSVSIAETNNGLVVNPAEEHRVILMPFQNTIDNAVFVAKSTSENISNWHKEQAPQKSNYLNLLSHKISQRNNLFTIFVAVALSWLFLTFSNPFDKIRLEKENEILSKDLAISRSNEKNMDEALENGFNKYEAQITKLKAEIELLKKK